MGRNKLCRTILIAATGLSFASVPQAKSRFQNGRANSFIHVCQGNGRCLADLIEQLRHASMSQRVTGSQKGSHLRIRSPVDRIGEKVQRRFRPEILLPEREQFPANLSESGWALGCALHGRQNIRLALKPINDARQVAPQRHPQISLQMAPGFRRSQVIKLETRSRERPVRDLSLGLSVDSLDLINHTYAPERLRREC